MDNPVGGPKPDAQPTGAPLAAGHASAEDTIVCPACGQMLAASCRVCVSCKQPLDPTAIRRAESVLSAPPSAPTALPPARFSWPLFFLTLSASWLLATLAVTFLGVIQAQLLVGGLQVLSAFWVFFDARDKRIPKALRWGLAALFLWIVFFPWYLSRRRTPEASCPFVESGSTRMMRWLFAAYLLLFLLGLLIVMKHGPNLH